jgi:hypothetical protein
VIDGSLIDSALNARMRIFRAHALPQHGPHLAPIHATGSGMHLHQTARGIILFGREHFPSASDGPLTLELSIAFSLRADSDHISSTAAIIGSNPNTGQGKISCVLRNIFQRLEKQQRIGSC